MKFFGFGILVGVFGTLLFIGIFTVMRCKVSPESNIVEKANVSEIKITEFDHLNNNK